MSLHEKKSRIHFHIKNLDNNYLPSCHNIHCEKDFIKNVRSRTIIDSTKKALFQKKPTLQSIVPLANVVLDRISRKKATDIFKTLNILKTMKKTSEISKEKTLINMKLLPKKPEIPSKNQKIKESLQESSKKEISLRRSSVLNTINLIPNAYKSKNSSLLFTENDIEITEKIKEDKIKTSVEKNSTKIFGIDRLIKGRIQKIFGKGISIVKQDFFELNPLTKPKKKRKKQRISYKNVEYSQNRDKIMKKLSIFDQKKHASEHEQLNLDLYNYKIDEMREDMIENVLEEQYTDVLSHFSNQKQMKNPKKIESNLISEEENAIFLGESDDPFVYKKAVDLIMNKWGNDDIETPRNSDGNDNFMCDLSQNLRKQGYYLFGDYEEKKKKTKFPSMRTSSNLSNLQRNSGFLSVNNENSNKNQSFSKNLNETEKEEKNKYSGISTFIDKSCFDEHRNNRVLIRDLKGKSRGIIGTLRNLTNKLGILTHYQTNVNEQIK